MHLYWRAHRIQSGLVLLTFGEKHRYLNAGDVMNTKGALSRKYAAKYDFDGKASQRKRDELIDYARQHGYKILAYHDNRENIIEV